MFLCQHTRQVRHRLQRRWIHVRRSTGPSIQQLTALLSVVTGLYDDNFLLADWEEGTMDVIKLCQSGPKPKKKGRTAHLLAEPMTAGVSTEKVSFHPSEPVFAVTTRQRLCLYQEQAYKSKERRS